MFFCNYCPFKSSELAGKISHIRTHRNIAKGFHCGYGKCPKLCLTQSGLRTHVNRLHGIGASDARQSLVSARLQPLDWVCQVATCGKVLPNYKLFMEHLVKHISCGVEVKCPLRNCENVFLNVNTLRVHITRKHRNDDKSPPNVEVGQSLVGQGGNQPLVSDQVCEQVESSVGVLMELENEGENCDNVQSPAKSSALFCLKLESQLLVPSSTVQTIAEEIHELQKGNVEKLTEKLTEILREENMSADKINSVTSKLFADNLSFPSELGTSYLRKQYYKRMFDFVEPVQSFFTEPDGAKSDKFFYYVPISETLKALFQDPDFKSQFQRGKQSEPGMWRDIWDGKAFKDNPFFIANPDGVFLVLYSDAFEVVSPIGSARTKHKVVGVYMIIGNTSVGWRSHPENIQLVALCKEKEMDESQLLEVIVKDLQNLESDGLQLPSCKVVKGSLGILSADNLGAHSIGGFTVNFSTAQYICRFCLMTRQEFQSDGRFCCTCPRRTPDNYNDAVRICADEGYSDYQGVKLDSKLNQLDFFHVTTGLSPCIAHDLFEGIVRVDLALFLKHLIRVERWFTVRELNNLIQTFPYSIEDAKDKPVPLSEQCKQIGGKACQVCTFIRLLPLLLMRKIKDPSNEMWYAILQLREVVLLATSPAFDVDMLVYMNNTIKDYIDLRAKLFPETPLRPKHHYLTHYAELVVMFGPLIRVWTLRFESKHRFFKRVVRSAGNFINLLKTLSEKHEYLQCYLRCGARLRSDVVSFGDSSFDVDLYAGEIRLAITESNAQRPLTECTRLQFKGTLYRLESVVVLSRSRSFLWDVTFGVIRRLICDAEQKVFFLVQEVKGDFNASMQTYLLGETLGFRCVSPESLADYHPLHKYTVDTEQYVVLKHAVPPAT